jgi:putative copper resistance protein D
MLHFMELAVSLEPQHAVWLCVIAIAGFTYISTIRKAHAASHPPPAWKAWAFFAGLAATAAATASPIERLGNEVLWVDFLGFLLLTMVAAPLFVLSSPITLVFRAVGPVGRRRLRRFYRSRAVTLLSFPAITWLGFAAATYVWQFSPLTEFAAQNVFLRSLQLSTLLLVSLLFWWPALGCDPIRVRLNHPFRVFYVGVEMVHKGLFGGMFLSMTSPIHDHFARANVSWAPSPMTDQRIAILILWIGGNLIFVAALLMLVIQWTRYEARNTLRVDRRLEQRREAIRQRRAALDQVFDRGV